MYWYLILVGQLNLIEVHYITDSYHKENSTNPLHRMQLTNKDSAAIFIVSQYADAADFLFLSNRLQFTSVRSYRDTKGLVSTAHG